jgi:MFS transporter, ACS family, D-galactonate transporter
MVVNGTRERVPAGEPTRIRFAVLGWLCAGAMLAYLHRFCISVPYETIRDDLLLTPRQMNLVVASFFAGYSLLQIPSGWLGDRWGSRRALALFAASWSVATAFMGLANGFLMALAAWVVNGLGQAGIFPCCVKSISRWFPASGRAFPSGMLTSFMSIGSIAAGALIGDLLVSFSWRQVVLMVALPGVVYAVGFYAWFRDTPAEHSGVNEAERHLIQGDKAAAAQSSLQVVLTPWRTILTSPTMLLLCSQQFFRAMAAAFSGTLFPIFLQKQYEISVPGSGRLMSLVVLAFVIGASTGGALADFILRRTGSLRHSRRSVALGSLLSCAGLLVLAYLVEGLPITFALIVASTFCSGFCGPIAYTVTIDLGGRHVATVFSVMNMAGNIGAFGFPLVAGELAESVSWQSVLLLVAGLNFAALLSWILLNVERPIVEKPD